MGRSSVFSLEQIYRKQVVGTWSKIPEVFRYVNSLAVPATTGGPAYGYFAGGESNVGNSDVSTIDRLDYASDTSNALAKSKLNTPAPWIFGTATSNTSYGWFGSAKMGTSLVERLDFENDTANTSPKGNLSQARYYLAGTGNADYGYFIGGSTPSESSTIDRIDYSNDTATAAVKGPLSTARRITGATGNQSFGYAGGGATGNGGPDVTTVDRINYSNDTPTTSLKGPLSSARQYHTAHGNANFGYFVGDKGNGAPGGGSVIDRIDYGNDTATASPKGSLSPDVGYFSGTGSASFGYSGGGSPKNSRINRIDYSNDTTVTTPVGNLSVTRAYLTGAVSGQESGLATAVVPIVPATVTESWTVPVGNDAGYFTAGGAPSPYYSVVDRIDFNNDTAVAATKSPTLVATRGSASVNSTTFGYSIAGGTEDAPTGYKTSTVSRLSFAGDTSTQVSVANYPVEAGGITGATGNTDFGYISGGYTPAALSSVYRMDYSSDSIAASPKGPLTFTVQRNAAAGNQSFGWFAGGEAPSRVSTVQRIDYANDTATATVKGPLNLVNEYLGATGNASYGYFGGGYFTSKVDRIDYANDTPQTSPKGPLLYSFYSAATGNSSYGYWTQGHPSKTSIGRLEYANDTTTASPKGNLSLARFDTGALSSRINGFPTTAASTPVDKGAAGYTTSPSGPAMGYVLGGAFPYSFSTVDRIDYSNDTGTAAVKGPLSAGTSYQAAVSSKDHGYSLGGKTPGESKSSKVDRVDYANDTATAAVKGSLSAGYYRSYAAVGNKEYGYLIGGNYPSAPWSSITQRIEYANDTATASPKGKLQEAVYLSAGAGNLSYGYTAGGQSPSNGASNYSTVERLDYASDTTNAVVKGPLAQGARKLTATGTASYGYWGGGTSPDISIIQRVDYASDTSTAVAKGPLTMIRDSFGSFSAPGHGYFAGGKYPVVSSIDRMDYSSDTTTAVAKGNLSGNRGYFSGVSSRDIGGSLSGTPTFIPRIRWVDSASEGTPITQGPAHGYFAGGAYPSVSSNKSTVDRIDYDNDTVTASPKGNLASETKRNDAVMNMTHGYVTGDMGPAPSRVHRIDYANDTATASIKGPLSANTSYMMDVTNINFGYVIGGGGPSGQKSKIDRIDFSNDTATASNIASLPSNRWSGTGIGNKNFGYICGGKTPSIISNIDRLDYSSDTTAVAPKGPLSAIRRYNTATSNNDFGYVAGNGNNSNTSLDRVDFSNDTATASPKGPLATAASYRTGTGSASFGYFAGGQNPGSVVKSNIDRIDFSNDTATASPKGPLSIAKNKAAGISARESGLPITHPTIAAPVQPPFPFPVQAHNPFNYGYFAGGYDYDEPSAPTGDVTLIQRIDFTNDTATALLKGNLSSTPGVHKSTSSNKNYGYIVGGNIVPSVTRVDRVDYTNDTATTSIRGPITGPVRGAMAGAGNNDYGWHAGGIYAIPSRTVYSKVDRIDYSNDSSTATPKGPLIAARGYYNATGTLNYGYFAGGTPDGQFGPNSSTVQRIDYGNDTTTSSTKGPLSRGTSQHASTGNANYGWFIGGYGPNSRSKIDRVDYASDTSTASVRGPLYQPSYRLDGTGNSNYGYVHPGLYPGNPAGSGGSTEIARIDYSNDTITTGIRGHFARSMRIQESAFSAAENGRS